ncbi:MAG: class I SAM-dependent methyltransferase [Ignavibacteria bacterium]|nr:class I SAM-dependent methyltransferase [Ignavibacteria bacterium]
MYVTREKKHYESEQHPVLKNGLEKLFPADQLFSVESALDSVIPWIEYVCGLKNKNVLIFGTGLGGTTVACAMNIGNGKVYGVDISSDAIDKTRIKAEAYGVSEKIELYSADDTYPLKYDDNFFDITIAADVIEHIKSERKKYIKEIYRVTKKGGILYITGTPNLIYPKDMHTTGLYFIPWMTSETAYKYAVWRNRWKKGGDIDYAGRKGTTYWHIKHWLKGSKYEILNLRKGFTSDYLKPNNRLMSRKRKILFFPYRISENILSKIFGFPVAAIMPYINHLFIRKID